MTSQLEPLFEKHLNGLLAQCEVFFAELGTDCLILGSGKDHHYFEDDQARPFRNNAMFSYFCPLEGPGHWLRIEPGKRPVLARWVPEDYWHAAKPFPAPFEDGDSFDWTRHFDVRQGPTPAEAFEALGDLPAATVFLGEDSRFAAIKGFACNPFLMVSQLQWMRSFKSEFEVECLSRANRIAARGHAAARERFLSGGSEFDILMAYQQGVCQTELALPYNPIIGIGPHAAVLHYQYKDTARRGGGVSGADSLLIDAGARYGFYGSDVTRTHLSDSTTPEAQIFATLLARLEQVQQSLCNMVRPGIGFADLQRAMHTQIAELLRDAGIIAPHVDMGSELARKLTVAFIPHGIGHLLGLFVHDVGGHMQGPSGQPITGVPRVAHLRSYRTLEPGMVLTIEPGLYFIDLLLGRLRADPLTQKAICWDRVAGLWAFGGIRIEDNVLVTKSGHRNLTREQGF